MFRITLIFDRDLFFANLIIILIREGNMVYHNLDIFSIWYLLHMLTYLIFWYALLSYCDSITVISFILLALSFFDISDDDFVILLRKMTTPQMAWLEAGNKLNDTRCVNLLNCHKPANTAAQNSPASENTVLVADLDQIGVQRPDNVTVTRK